jgi:hypothetical protein
MSEVISFRLNKANLREAQALEVLELWCTKGYSVRNTLTEALLKLNGISLEPIDNHVIQELYDSIRQTNELLEQIGNGNIPEKLREPETPSRPLLSNHFVAAIKRSIKPGLEAIEDPAEPREMNIP